MAKPANKLDRFVTYIPHYELHVAGDWPELKTVETADANAATTPTQPTNTLLINTRKDAHQQIDNVRFSYLAPSVDPSGAMHPISFLTLEVIEPNGTSFIEKIQNVQEKYDVSNIMSGLLFGLKIFFVGRLADGTDETLPFSSIIPMHISTLDAKFTHKGGEYHMSFNLAGSAGVASNLQPNNGLAHAVVYTNKTVSLKSNTVQDAIKQLEQKLNKNYEDVYKTERENPGAKTLSYTINLDPEISGNLHLSTKDTYGSGEPCQLVFNQQTSIETMIRQILYSSKEVNEMIGDSRDTIFKEFHPNVRIPIIKASYVLNPSEASVVYDVSLYKGGRIEDNIFEFDYYFSGPGKNVDVMDFEIRFPGMVSWMSSSKFGTNRNSNNDSMIPSTDPKNYCKNVTHEDTTRPTIYDEPGEQTVVDIKPGDVCLPVMTNNNEDTGYAKYQAHAVPAARLAFETIGLIASATHNQLGFTIRGHFQILEKVILYPNDTDGIVPLGIDNGIWCKVNIFNKDGSPFFYTGFYRLLSVDNIFSGGRFTQLLRVMMVDKE